MVRGDTKRTSNATLRKLRAGGDPVVSGLASELLQARDDLRSEAVRCADLAARHSIEASAAIRESAQIRENVSAVGRRRDCAMEGHRYATRQTTGKETCVDCFQEEPSAYAEVAAAEKGCG